MPDSVPTCHRHTIGGPHLTGNHSSMRTRNCCCVCDGGSGACTAVSQQEGPGFDSHMGRCWSWGVSSPQAFSAQVGYLPGLSVWSLHVLPRPSVLRWAISRAFLCGVCMFSPCSQGVSSTKDPNRKN